MTLIISIRFVFVTTVLLLRIHAKAEPKFVGSGTNVTVVVGRDATLACKVQNLMNFKVAWLRVDTQTILTIGPHVITKNHRVGVTRGDGQTWTLTLKEARPNDGGMYMCQVNTEPMITQTHYLQVVVPPDIVDTGTSGEIMVREGDNVSLHCAASGTPQPTVTWRREDFANMKVEGEIVKKWSGLWLNLSQVDRIMNGAVLCIATNGVPPSVSKRIMLHVLCAPSANTLKSMINGFIEELILLECEVEANPAPIFYWTFLNINRIYNGSKYQVSMKSEGYRHRISLCINRASREDIGSYQCHVENYLGTSYANVTLYDLVTTTTTTISTTTFSDDLHVNSTESYVELEEINKIMENNQLVKEDESYVVVLSQHQMQNLDLSPSS